MIIDKNAAADGLPAALTLNVSSPDLADLMRDVLQKDADFRFRATGFSMSPFIKDGDVITVSPSHPADLRTGDIVAFTQAPNDRLVVHRIIWTGAGYFCIKGDNTKPQDSSVPAYRILGRITGIDRNGKSVRLGLGPERTLISFLSRLGVLCLLFAPARILFRLSKHRYSSREMQAITAKKV